MVEAFELFIVLLGGLVFGSFLNVIIVRMPEGDSIILPASHCPHCLTPLRWWHNIPVFSYFVLRGKCAFCRETISPLYPIVEILSMFMAACLYFKIGFNSGLASIFITFALFLSLSIIDMKTQFVPDSLNFSALIAALIYGFSFESLEAAFILAGALTLLRFGVSSFLRSEAMGEGDIIIAASMGAILGMKLAFVAVFVAAVLAIPVMLIFCKKYPRIAFVPFLFLGTLIVFFLDSYVLLLLKELYG